MLARITSSLIVLALVMAGLTARAEECVLDAMAPGHSAKFHTTGPSSYHARHTNFSDADVILVKAYAILDDETGRAEMKALAARAKAGAKVFVEYDVKGTAHSIPSLVGLSFRNDDFVPKHLRPLVEAGAFVIPTNKPKLGNVFRGRDHDKLIITWKKGEPVRVIMGGMNMGNPYAWSGVWRKRAHKPEIAFRDTDIELSGPKTKEIIESFVTATERAHSPLVAQLKAAIAPIHADAHAFAATPSSRDVEVAYLRSDPRYAPDAYKIEKAYIELIGKTPAGETVTISNAYFLPSKRFKAAMVAASKRDVRFHFVVNSMKVPEKAAQWVASAFRDELRGLYKLIPESHLKVTEWNGNLDRNEGAIHQKIGKFGDGPNAPVVGGSANLDPLARHENSETVVVMRGKAVAKQFDGVVGRMLHEGDVRALDRRALSHDSLWQKAKSKFHNRVLRRFL